MASSVQSAFGPIVEPGWVDLKGGPDMGAKFLSGAYILGNLNAKRREMEAKIASLSLKAQADQQDRELDNKRYQLAVDRLTTGNEFKDYALDIQNRHQNLREDQFRQVLTKYDDQTKGDQAMIDAAASLRADGIEKDDPKYPDEFLRRVTAASAHADPAKFRTLVQSNIGDYNINANRQAALLEHQEKNFREFAGTKLYGDPTLGQHLDPVIHPEQYPEEIEGGGGWWSNVEKWATGKPYGEEEPGKKTGYTTVNITTPTGDTIPKKVAVKDIVEVTKQWKALEEAKKKRLPPVDLPSFDIYSKPASTERERAQRVLDSDSSSPQAKEMARLWFQNNP